MENQKIEKLKKAFGDYDRVAEELKVTRRAVLNYRRGKMPARVEKMVDLIIKANGNG